MKTKKHNLWFFFGGTLFLSILGWYANAFTPTSIERLVIFLTLCGAGIFFFIVYITDNVRHGIIISSTVIILLILRYLQLKEWIYPALLAAVALSIELYLEKR